MTIIDLLNIPDDFQQIDSVRYLISEHGSFVLVPDTNCNRCKFCYYPDKCNSSVVQACNQLPCELFTNYPIVPNRFSLNWFKLVYRKFLYATFKVILLDTAVHSGKSVLLSD